MAIRAMQKDVIPVRGKIPGDIDPQAGNGSSQVESDAGAKGVSIPQPPLVMTREEEYEECLTTSDVLAKHRLAAPRAKTAMTKLGEFLSTYIAKRSDVKGSTSTVYGHTQRCLIEYFKADKLLSEITFADAKDWRRWLALSKVEGGQGLADNMLRRRCGIARQFFTDAVEARLIAENPFQKMKGVAVRANKSRDYFVTRKEAEAVLAACPDSQWRLLFVLCRYGGLRCPSEPLALRWGDIDWERVRITVHSPKTEHHDGKDQRVIPLFPELLPFLETA